MKEELYAAAEDLPPRKERSMRKKRTAEAMSSGVPTLPAGCCAASGPVYTVPSVSIQPGEMLFTRAFSRRVTASACVSAAMPPFAAV